MPEHRASPPPPNPPKLPLKGFGGYDIEGELGRGGMGVVYLARQIELNRLVALKMLTGHYGPDELRRFLEEAETAAALNHPNIVHIYEVGEHEGAPFFSMEYVKEGSLADAIRQEQPAPREAARLLMEVARAVHFAHQNGVVHRDIKPANILIGPDGDPKVTDFGIAKRLDDDAKLTRSGAVLGTPTYMAPEQAKGHSRHVGPAADIYSLGAILYEMLAGRPPFLPEDSETAVTVRVLTEDPVSPAWHKPDVPRDLENICMKCLEKEPRNRYASAAALAEDLRRYLDDEPVLARPPSTVVSSIRWVRRNPWKVVAGMAAFVLIVVGVMRLVQWELYHRPHFEYATQVVWVNGRLEPTEKVSQEDASRHATYLRLTRRGRSGPVTKVEVLNARGYPAELRRIQNDEVLPIYIESLAGAQPYYEKLPESATVEFLDNDGDNVLEAISRDRNGQANWRMIYDHPAGSGNLVEARFVNLRGFDAPTRYGASHIEFERDDKGRDAKIIFFNTAGKPAANGEGVYGYKLDYDDAGRITQLINLGADGNPTANRVGLIAFTRNWGKTLRAEVRDAKGQPAVLSGIAATVTELDSVGNPVRVTNLGTDGKPVRDAAASWSVQEMKRNEHGELIQSTQFKADAEGALKQVWQTNISYDDFGYPTERELIGQTSSKVAWHHDAKGNITEERFFNEKGEPVLSDQGYAIKRLTYTSEPHGLRVEETYFDAAGEKAYSKGGNHRLITEYDAAIALRRLIQDEYDPAQYKYARFVIEPEFDAQGHSAHIIFRFEDAQGNPATDANLIYHTDEKFFDENGRVKTEWQIGRDPKVSGGPVWRIETEWYSSNKMKRRVQQVCDENRQPLAVLSNGTPARIEVEYDESEQPVRISETGFDEQAVGFSTREVKYSDGNVQSVSHTRSDGTVLKSVGVVIASVTPPTGQPKSAELRAGDQIVAINGKPLTTVYLFPGKFPGGSLEILREGQRIRLDGFNPGELGVALMERAETQ